MQLSRLPLLLALAVVSSSCGTETPSSGKGAAPSGKGAAPASTTDTSAIEAPSPTPPEPQPKVPPATIVPELPPDMDPVMAMYSTVDELFARPEHGAPQVVVQHCLIGVGPDFGGRGPAEAEKLSAQILQDLAGGAKFTEVVKKNTNDTYPGIYVMLAEGQPDPSRKVFLRSEMAQAFGDAAWRLKIGEVGITPYDPPAHVAQGQGTSPYGMHIIKRLQ